MKIQIIDSEVIGQSTHEPISDHPDNPMVFQDRDKSELIIFDGIEQQAILVTTD